MKQHSCIVSFFQAKKSTRDLAWDHQLDLQELQMAILSGSDSRSITSVVLHFSQYKPLDLSYHRFLNVRNCLYRPNAPWGEIRVICEDAICDKNQVTKGDTPLHQCDFSWKVQNRLPIQGHSWKKRAAGWCEFSAYFPRGIPRSTPPLSPSFLNVGFVLFCAYLRD